MVELDEKEKTKKAFDEAVRITHTVNARRKLVAEDPNY